jgi:ABC-2 type transport system ATP-binding protein
MGRPDLLILDEPSSGLDPLNEHEIRRCILEAKERGQTVLLSSHQLSEVEAVCDRVAILHAGRLVEHGTLAELRGLDAVCVDVTFAGEAPDLTTVPGVPPDWQSAGVLVAVGAVSAAGGAFTFGRRDLLGG